MQAFASGKGLMASKSTILGRQTVAMRPARPLRAIVRSEVNQPLVSLAAPVMLLLEMPKNLGQGFSD